MSRRRKQQSHTGAKLAAAGAAALVMASGVHHHHHHWSVGAPSVLTAIGAVPGGSAYSPQSWARAFLRYGSFPRTAANVTSVVAWENHEGGAWANSAQDNPLNSTQPEPGSWSINPVGVQAYPTWAEGFRGNMAVLANGPVGDVVAALKSGRGLCGRSFTGLHNWSAGPAGPASAGYWSVC